MVKIILIDVDDTLLDFQKCSRTSLQQAFMACGLEFKDHYQDIFISINSELWKQFERKEITEERLFDIRFQLVFEALHLQGDSQLAETTFRKQLGLSHEVMDGALELLEYLSHKYTLYIVSNSQYQRQVNRLKLAKMDHYFKDIYTSGRMNAVKPEYEFFEACFAAMNYPSKEDVVLIGDSLTADIQGAVNYGIKPIWLHKGKDDLDVIQVEKLLEIKKYL